jgi:hypothetical protein
MNSNDLWNRRHWLLAMAGALSAPLAVAQTPLKPLRISRLPGAGANGPEMQVFQVKDLGLEIWMDAGWDADMHMNNGRATFVATSPESFDLPAAITVSTWPEKKLPDILVPAMARSAIRTAAPNFGLPASQAKAIVPTLASYGVLKGGQADFIGKIQGIDMDVRIFVGQAKGQYPVVLTFYAPKGGLNQLVEVINRSWGHLDYLA